MKTLNKDAMSTTAQLIGLSVQSFAIIALATTLFMFVDRLVVCTFYQLPIVYNSLDLIRAVPVAATVLFLLFYSLFILLGFSMVANDIKSVSSRLRVKIGTVSIKKDNKILASLKHKLTSINKYESKTRIQKETNNKKLKNKQDDKASEIKEDILNLQLAIFVNIICTVIWRYFLSTPLSEKSYFYLDNIGGMCLSIACIIEIVYMRLILKKMRNEVAHVLNKRKIVDYSGNMDTSRQDAAIWKKITMCIICLFVLVCSCIITLKAVYLVDKSTYGIVEISNNDAQAYAVVLNLDEHFVLEPVEEKDNELIIKCGQYMYKDKNELLVTYKKYGKVSVRSGLLVMLLDRIDRINDTLKHINS